MEIPFEYWMGDRRLPVSVIMVSMWLREPVHYVGTYANENMRKHVRVYMFVPVGACLHVCIYKGLAHPTILSLATTHTDRCEDWREREPRFWSMASLSKYYSLPISVSLSCSVIQYLSLSFTLCILSFPLCQTQRASLLFRVGNATGAKYALFSVWYHPSFVLAVSHHHALGLRRHQPDTWEQVKLRKDRSRDVLDV